MAAATVPVGHINTFRIGCDPEFSLLDKDGFIKYASYCTSAKSDDSGYSYNPIGTDAGGVVELRPEPSYTVQGLLVNIKKMLDDPTMNRHYKDYKWRGGALVEAKSRCEGRVIVEKQALGGHVHLELPFKGYHGIPDRVFDTRVQACDAVTIVLEELDILPKEECKRRQAVGYGKYGQVYHCGAATFTRMEYRTPCSWLFSPNAAYITLTSIKLAAAMPEVTINKFTNLTTELQRWEAMVEYFRLFRAVDSDAHYVYHKIFKGKRLDNLNRLKAQPDVDIKVAWAKFKTGETNVPQHSKL